MEIQQLEKRVRNLQLQSEGERLTQELKAIEAGIREKQKELEDGGSHFQLAKTNPVVEEVSKLDICTKGREDFNVECKLKSADTLKYFLRPGI